MESRPTWLAFTSDTRVMALLLAGGVMALVVVFIVLLSNASFSDQTRSNDNRFSAGKAALQLSQTGAIVDAANLKAGDSRSGDIQVTNTGERARVSVAVKGAAADPALASALRLKITARGAPGTVFYDGSLGNAGRVELGTLGPGEASALTFQISLPSGSDPALAGRQLDAAFEWEARTG